jgi:hypothetical protein
MGPRPQTMSLAEPIAVTLEITSVLEKLGIRYAVGGQASYVCGVRLRD